MSLPLCLERIADTVRDVAKDDGRILAVYLFGSHAENTATAESDVDLGVLFDRSTSVTDRVQLEARLSEVLGQQVDLVDVGACNAYLALAIIRGERLYETDPVRCDEFDLYVMRRAGDLEPFESQRRKMLLAAQPLVLSGNDTRRNTQ